MSILKLNLNNPVINKNVNVGRKVSEFEFWKFYFTQLSKKHELTKQEVDIISYIAAGDIYKSYFSGEERKKICKDLELSSANLSRYKKAIVKKGFLQETGVVQGDVILSPKLIQFQRYIKKQVEKDENFTILFMYPLKIIK